MLERFELNVKYICKMQDKIFNTNTHNLIQTHKLMKVSNSNINFLQIYYECCKKHLDYMRLIVENISLTLCDYTHLGSYTDHETVNISCA